jgi:Fe-S cluster biogenesis protein NfuA
MQEATVETALAGVRPALAADGFDLRLGSIGPDGSVKVVLEAKENACLDCLVPDEMLVQILDKAIRDQDAGLGSVVLDKVGFDAVADH